MSAQADPIVEELIGLVFDAAGHLSADFNAAGAEHGLPHTQALLLVNLDEPMPMRAIANTLSCEPSNVTGIVDGLERRGFVVRQADPADRRVKQVVLTPEGKRTRDALRSRGYAHADAFFDLPAGKREQLRDLLSGLLERVSDDAPAHPMCGEPRPQKARGATVR
jgi:DNA-binding MarR family transcriptional regulator